MRQGRLDKEQERCARAGLEASLAAGSALLQKRESALDAAVRAIEAVGGRAAAVACDLADRAGIPDALARAIACFGPPDILLNAAGINPRAPVESVTPDAWDRTLEINLSVPFFLAQRLAPAMCERGYGRVVHIGADSVRNGLPDHAVYNAAKGGVHGLTTGLAREFARSGVTVNTVAPCAVNSEQLAALVRDKPELAQRFLGVIPMGRAAELDEVTSMVLYMASRDASFVTGQVISVNGGSAML